MQNFCFGHVKPKLLRGDNELKMYIWELFMSMVFKAMGGDEIA